MDGTYEPELYDLITPGAFRGDIEWYRRKARECGGRVLELGAGTGRITLAIAQDGVPVCALDAHRGMLDALRRKAAVLSADVRARIVVTESDMRSFELGQSFALVIAPFRAFLHNVTEDDRVACLRRVHGHLQPGGHFAFNVFHPSLEYMAHHAGALEGVWRWRDTCALADGGHVVRSEANRYDTVRQKVYSLHRYEQYGPSGELARTYLHRLELAYLYAGDIRRLLEQTGFDEIDIAGGFDGHPFSHDTDELVVVARRG